MHRAALLLAVAVVLAGCSGPDEQPNPSASAGVDDTTSTTVSPSPSIPGDGETDSTSASPASGLPSNAPDITSEEVAVAPDLSISIREVRQAGGQVSASAAVSAGGTCVFLFAPSDGSRPVVREAPTRADSCSVTIPEVEFALLGGWTLRTTLYHDGAKAEDTTDVTIH